MPRPYSEELRWRAIGMKEILGYQVDEVAAASRMASVGVLPHSHEFQEATPTKAALENITLLLIRITLTCLTSTETANYPVTKLVGVALKLRKLNEKFAVVRSFSQKQP